MDDSLTDITIVLDRSGSMASTRTDAMGGFNTLLDDQKNGPGRVQLSVAQFDHEYESLYEGKDLAEAPRLDDDNYKPRGTTALLDAIGKTINRTGRRLTDLDEEKRPHKVIFVIVTDGYENSSKEFSMEQVNKMIDEQRDTYKWEFMFIGANQDAIATASKIGIPQAQAMTYAANAVGTAKAYSAVSSGIRRARRGQALCFSDEDRAAQKNAGASSSSS